MQISNIESKQSTRRQAISNHINAIALEEAAVSKILDAESKSIQTINEKQDVSQFELLSFNTSIQSIINAITRLEMILQCKLELLS